MASEPTMNLVLNYRRSSANSTVPVFQPTMSLVLSQRLHSADDTAPMFITAQLLVTIRIHQCLVQLIKDWRLAADKSISLHLLLNISTRNRKAAFMFAIRTNADNDEPGFFSAYLLEHATLWSMLRSATSAALSTWRISSLVNMARSLEFSNHRELSAPAHSKHTALHLCKYHPTWPRSDIRR